MRREFPTKVKRDAFMRCGGLCEAPGCGAKLGVGKHAFDHDTPDSMGGDNSLENCRVLCLPCHDAKTRGEAPVRAKAVRAGDKFRGIRPRSRFSCSRDSRWKKKISGEVVPR